MKVIVQLQHYDMVQGLGIEFGEGDKATRYVVSFAVNDPPGVIAEMLTILAENLRAETPCAFVSRRAVMNLAENPLDG